MRDTIKSLAKEIQAAHPKWCVIVDRGFCNTDRKLGRGLSHRGKGRWGSRILVRNSQGDVILFHNNAETYRCTSEVRAWMHERGIP